MHDVDNVTEGRLSRRRMLQATVASGVGVAAWSAPNIKTLGFKPAYGAICSQPTDVTVWYSNPIRVGCPTPSAGSYARLQGPGYFGPSGELMVELSPHDSADGTIQFVCTAPGYRARVKTLMLVDEGGTEQPHPIGADQMAPVLGLGAYCSPGSPTWYWHAVVETIPEYGCWAEEHQTPA